jgi:CubicO group peptidase (beta-lactamase class C family)
MKRLLIVPIILLAVIHSFAQKQKNTTSHLDGLDTAFARVLKTFKAPGFAIAVVDKDKVIYSKGFGYSNYEAKTPVSPNTLFAIGSCTKAFTAGLLGILNKDGKVDYDKPVRTYLPDVQFYNADLNNNVTLRDMMCHRTGLPRHDMSWYLFPTSSRDSLVQRIQYLEPSAAIRQRWQYNNFMFMLQGAVAEKLTGKSWEDNIRQQFFEPLGMSRSNVSLAEWMKADDIAAGYDIGKDSSITKLAYYNIAGMAPAGSINSSVNDMAKWVIMWINGGKYNGKEVLPAGYAAEAISSQMVINGALPTTEMPDVYMSNYGFGWVLSSYRGHYRVEHNGNIDGFSASTSFFPSDNIGIVVLCNQNSSAIPSVVRNIVADKLLGMKYLDWDTRIKAQQDKARAAAKEAEQAKVKDTTTTQPATHPLTSYTGIFANKGYGKIQLQIVHDSLQALNTSHMVYLKHKTYDLFNAMMKDETGFDTTFILPAHFEMDDKGNISKLLMEVQDGVQPIVFERIPEVKPVPKDSLKKYVGDFAVTPAVSAKVYIKADSVLYLFVPGQPEYELVPVEENKFTIKNANGYSLQFNTNSEGKITEVLFIQPNGTFKATKKEE